MVSANTRVKRDDGQWHWPCHRDLMSGVGDNATVYSRIYTFHYRPSILWLYPDTEAHLTDSMKRGLASLIGIHKITPETAVKSNTTRKTLFFLKEVLF